MRVEKYCERCNGEYEINGGGLSENGDFISIASVGDARDVKTTTVQHHDFSEAQDYCVVSKLDSEWNKFAPDDPVNGGKMLRLVICTIQG